MDYKAFFNGLEKRVTFNCSHGIVNVSDLFDLSMDELLNVYKSIKTSSINDPIIEESLSESDSLRITILRELILWRRAEAKKTQKRLQLKELERMYKEAKLRKLVDNPEAIEEEINKLREEAE